MYVSTYVFMCVCIYICRERERERDYIPPCLYIVRKRESRREGERAIETEQEQRELKKRAKEREQLPELTYADVCEHACVGACAGLQNKEDGAAAVLRVHDVAGTRADSEHSC
jgi:hypothetical protein